MRLLPALAVALGTVHVACLSMERIPTGTEIREWPALQSFILHAIDITGVYQNIDIDSVVFHYTSTITDEVEFWRQLRQAAQSAGWVQTDGQASIDRRQGEVFQRLKPKGELWFSSAEELRVAHMPDRIIVAYVQSDQDGDPKPVHQASEVGLRISTFGLGSFGSCRTQPVNSGCIRRLRLGERS